MSNAAPVECLDIFDEFELDSMRQRRLAIYALEDYYGTVLVEVGQEYLGLKPDDIDKSIKTLWNISKQRLQLLSDIEVPEKYNRILYKLSDERNSVGIVGYSRLAKKPPSRPPTSVIPIRPAFPLTTT